MKIRSALVLLLFLFAAVFAGGGFELDTLAGCVGNPTNTDRNRLRITNYTNQPLSIKGFRANINDAVTGISAWDPIGELLVINDGNLVPGTRRWEIVFSGMANNNHFAAAGSRGFLLNPQNLAWDDDYTHWTPFNPQWLVKIGSFGSGRSFKDIDSISLDSLAILVQQPWFYDPSIYVPDTLLGDRGGPASAGFINTWYDQEADSALWQIQMCHTDAFHQNGEWVYFNPLIMGQQHPEWGEGPMYAMALGMITEYFNLDWMLWAASATNESMAAMESANFLGNWGDVNNVEPGGISRYIAYDNDVSMGPNHWEEPTYRDVIWPGFPQFFPHDPTYVHSSKYSTTPGTGDCVGNSPQIANAMLINSVYIWYTHALLYNSTSFYADYAFRNAADPEMAAKLFLAMWNGGRNSVDPFLADLMDVHMNNPNIHGENDIGNDYIELVYRALVPMQDGSRKSVVNGGDKEVFDAPISLREIEWFYFGDGGNPSEGVLGAGGILHHFKFDYDQRVAIWDKILQGFNILNKQGPFSQDGNISLRYDWLALMRVVKGDLDLTIPTPINDEFMTWVQLRSQTNVIEDYGGPVIENEYPFLRQISRTVRNDSLLLRFDVEDETYLDIESSAVLEWTNDPDWGNWRRGRLVAGDTLQAIYEIGLSKEQVLQIAPEGQSVTAWVRGADRNLNATVDTFSIFWEVPNRLVVFYGDTAGYDQNAELTGQVGQRLPVVIRALSGVDNQVMTNVNSTVSLQLSSGLVAYTAESEGEQISQINLSSGQARIWVTGVTAVNNGSITTVPLEHPSLHSGSRSRIFFGTTETKIDYGEVYADNGYGRVDRLEVHYKQDLTQETLPDSVVLYWPSVESGQSRIAFREHMTLNPADNANVTVRFADPFPEEITTFSGTEVLATHFFTNPHSPGAAPVEIPFPVIDRVGPLISTAQVTEVSAPGIDTLILTFSEQLDLTTLTGPKLLLKKQGSGLEIPLTVQDILPSGGEVKLVVDGIGENSPVSGDSLRFNPGSGVRDSRGAEINDMNRAVVIGLRPENDFLVKVYDIQGQNRRDTVTVGEHVVLRVKPRVAGQYDFDKQIDDVWIGLQSGHTLFDASDHSSAVHIQSIPAFDHVEKEVVFTKVPSGGVEVISAADQLDNPAFFGVSGEIVILPAEPDRVVFIDPPSGGVSVINPDQPHLVALQVLDRYDNAVNQPVQISVESLEPQTGNIGGDAQRYTDNNGIVHFDVVVTGGGRDDMFTIRATLLHNGHTDDALLRVGRDRDRLTIFYADTLEYSEHTELRGNTGERLPVVIRAMGGEDGNRIIAERNNRIQFELHDGLILFGSEDADEPLTEAALNSGELRVWITAVTEVVNGSIEVWPVEDQTLLSGARAGVFFDMVSELIEHGVVFADNGDGRVDRMEIYYRRELDVRPDSIELFWPQRDGEHRRVVSGDYHLRLNSPQHLTVIFSDPFPEEITTYSGSRVLGTHYYNNPLTPDAQGERIPFTVIDSVGPLISTGLVSEKFRPGVDTLLLTFSEPVVRESLIGQTLFLRKQGAQTEIPLTVMQAIRLGDLYKLIIPDMGENAPRKGDFLRFHPRGGVFDARDGAGVHSSNRPVQLRLRPIPPEIDSAFYYDTNADGEVDRVVVWFNKEVVPRNVRAVFGWRESRTDTLFGDVSLSGDNNSASFDVRGVFGDETANLTSGRMYVSLTHSDYDPEFGISQSGISDRAAPVLTAASYLPGRVLENGRIAEDTLIVTFTEDIQETSLPSDPFRFIRHTNSVMQEYSLNLRYYKRDGLRYYFVVEPVNPGDITPHTGDSIYIAYNAGLADRLGNIQDNPGNRRVLLQSEEAEINWSFVIGPNPCSKTTYCNEMFIRIDSDRPGVGDDVHLKLDLAIYDRLGNVVYRDEVYGIRPGFQKSVWNLRNMNQRSVSTGTYLLIVTVTETENENVLVRERVKFGVAR
ncbi:hypothetical protein CHISP_0037 [Chitinispirillum alkaliphilum]|nr:hypothetical protein CHISP_0037 [Chitinispirillum alkaliphilum]